MTAANLNKADVTIDGGYTLELNGVSAPTQTKATNFDGLTHKTATISDGYTLTNNEITYTAASGGKKVFALTGVKNTTSVMIDTSKKTVTLNANNLNKTDVTIDGGYSLKLAKDVDTTKETTTKWTTLKSSNVVYLQSNSGEYYSLNGGKDVITDYATGDKISVSSNLGAATFSVSKKNVVLTYESNTLTITDGLDKKTHTRRPGYSIRARQR